MSKVLYDPEIVSDLDKALFPLLKHIYNINNPDYATTLSCAGHYFYTVTMDGSVSDHDEDDCDDNLVLGGHVPFLNFVCKDKICGTRLQAFLHYLEIKEKNVSLYLSQDGEEHLHCVMIVADEGWPDSYSAVTSSPRNVCQSFWQSILRAWNHSHPDDVPMLSHQLPDPDSHKQPNILRKKVHRTHEYKYEMKPGDITYMWNKDWY